MKRRLFSLLVFTTSLAIYSCASKEEKGAMAAEITSKSETPTLNNSQVQDKLNIESGIKVEPEKKKEHAYRKTDTKYIGMKWATEKTISPINQNCFDSLKFLKEGQVYVYDCEMDWHFLGDYYLSNDTIKIEIVDAQFEVENTEGYEPSSTWSLKDNGKKLSVVSIRQKSYDKWQEITTEELKKKLSFKKVK